MGARVCPALKFLNRPLPGGQVFTALTSREIIARRLVQDDWALEEAQDDYADKA